MKRVRSGITCPKCGCGCYEFIDGTLSEHLTDNYVWGQRKGGKIRERCVYSGGTFADAEARITPLRRTMIDNHARGGPK